jgi:hypothetical protein
MKITISLDTSDADEKMHLSNFIYASRYRRAVCEVDEYLRNKLKHGDLSDEVFTELDKIRSLLNEEIYDQEELM